MSYNDYYDEKPFELLSDVEIEMLHWREEREREQQRRKEKIEELQEIYVPLFKQCVDYYFERKEKSERINLDKGAKE
ncbi:hypothetical protein [Virgibacillus doumboii]|uniref:hypothetical protein n=1 Tax=Virgibacillus doumboii TaxID=2697503 RepID=UPI0013DEBDDF|nr:hypothetical protein [Virgibacillus doumboii]